MTCPTTLYNVKRIAYIPVSYSESDYLAAIGISGYKQLLINADGLTIDTKGETADYNELNGVKRVDNQRDPLRITGSLKCSKNFDSKILANHSDLLNAGLGKVNTGVLTTNVTAGKGSVDTPFLTASTTNLTVGALVQIDGTDKYFVVTSIKDNTSFTVEVPLTTTISSPTTFNNVISIDLSETKGTCDKFFNVVIELQDGNYIKLMGCTVVAEFTPVFEKQLTISFTFTSPSITTLNTIPAGFNLMKSETKGDVIMVNFSKVEVRDDVTETAIYPASFDLGFSVSVEPVKSITGLNNVLGYMNYSSIKPKMNLYRTSVSKTLVLTPRTAKTYLFFQDGFGLVLVGAKMTLIDQAVNNSNHENINLELDVNYSIGSRVFIIGLSAS